MSCLKIKICCISMVQEVAEHGRHPRIFVASSDEEGVIFQVALHDSGEREACDTRQDVVINFCPFCGTKLEVAE